MTTSALGAAATQLSSSFTSTASAQTPLAAPNQALVPPQTPSLTAVGITDSMNSQTSSNSTLLSSPGLANAPPLTSGTFTLGLTEVHELPLSNVVLTAGQPLVLDGLDKDRPVKRIDVEMTDGTARAQMGQLPPLSADGYTPPVYGTGILLGSGTVKRVLVTYGDPAETGDSDFYAVPQATEGVKPGQLMDFAIPAHRRGQGLENINVSFWAPVRQWDPSGRGGQGEEMKPTYCTWSLDSAPLQRKFVDPNATSGNTPEIDNVHGSNAQTQTVLAKVPQSPERHSIRVVAENSHIGPNETAMTVQWIKATYQPATAADLQLDLRGEALPNHEWKGHWVAQGQRFNLAVDPTWKIKRVDVQWSDKPDDVGYEAPGRWARGTVLLDGQPVGTPREHVASPEWQTFENTQGRTGGKLEILADDSPLKIFQIKIYREP
jgi:hypothetical protein